MRCLLVVNKMSGNSGKIDAMRIIAKHAPEDDVTIINLETTQDIYSVEGYDKLIVCGGDGTLNHAVNLCKNKDITIYYLPCGTFNEASKCCLKGTRGALELATIGRVNEADFTYVAATGSFTQIGHSASSNLKKKLKIFAYFTKVLAAYRVHHIPAVITTGAITLQDTYTLIMIINSRRCFGFNFNRMYTPNDDTLHLLTIKSPARNNFWSKIQMFFPFFRAFFIGFSKPKLGKCINFIPFQKLNLTLLQPETFCVDGELMNMQGELNISKHTTKARVIILKD